MKELCTAGWPLRSPENKCPVAPGDYCESCTFYTRTGLAEVIDWKAEADRSDALYHSTLHSWVESDLQNAATIISLRDLTDSLIACYEELAGEHRELLAALNSPRGVVWSAPLAADDKVSVRPYVRAKPRRSKLAAIEPDQGTVQAAPGEGQTGASGEATGHSPEGADKEQPCPGCGSYRGTHGLGCRILALTQSGEERSE